MISTPAATFSSSTRRRESGAESSSSRVPRSSSPAIARAPIPIATTSSSSGIISEKSSALR